MPLSVVAQRVAQQVVSAIGSNEQVLIAVVVVISYGDALAMSEVSVQSTSCGRVSESPVTTVAIERGMRAVIHFIRGLGGTGLNQDNVLESVVIVVHERAAGRRVLDEIELPFCSTG